MTSFLQNMVSQASLDSDSDQDFDDLGGSEPWEDQEVEISPEDEAALAAFMNPTAGVFKQRTLADIILDKIKEKQEAQAGIGEDRWVPRSRSLQPSA